MDASILHRKPCLLALLALHLRQPHVTTMLRPNQIKTWHSNYGLRSIKKRDSIGISKYQQGSWDLRCKVLPIPHQKKLLVTSSVCPEKFTRGHQQASKETLTKNKKKLKARACCTPVLSLRLCYAFGTARPKEGRQYKQIGSSNNSRAYHRAPKRHQLLTKS